MLRRQTEQQTANTLNDSVFSFHCLDSEGHRINALSANHRMFGVLLGNLPEFGQSAVGEIPDSPHSRDNLLLGVKSKYLPEQEW